MQRANRAPLAHNSHVYRPRSIFSDAHVAGENGFVFISPLRRRNSTRFFDTLCLPQTKFAADFFKKKFRFLNEKHHKFERKNKNIVCPVLIFSSISKPGVLIFPEVFRVKVMALKKRNVAVFFGGCSSEYGVSLQSAYAVIRNLDPEKYEPLPVGISRTGCWYLFLGNIETIRQDKWQNDVACFPAILSPNRGERKLLFFRHGAVEEIVIDIALPVLHGKNGEDGTVQGLIALSGIPLAGCGVLSSALCMDKDRAHKLVAASGVRTPKSIVLHSPSLTSDTQAFSCEVGFPLFVKPVKSGSSYGITKVQSAQDLLPAITTAFQYDNEVVLEENIDGFEVGCAVLGTDHLITGEVDEIELSQGFFDFTEKYTLKTSAIHVPARIPPEKAQEIKETAKQIYRILGCSGFARVDMFLTPSGEIVFNEVNTIPGFTEHSRYPGMMKAAGFSFPMILDRILEQAVVP